jgi:amidase
VAVAANLCAGAVGTETNGSISCPAAMNSVVGIKPTIGLVSRSGIIPIAKTQDTAGPLARTVKDAATLLGILAGKDPKDDATFTKEKEQNMDYTRFLNVDGLNGKIIGVEKTFLNGHEAITVLLKKALEQMHSKGATIVEVEFMEKYRQIGIEQRKVLQYEFKDEINRYLASAEASVKSLADIIQYNKEHEATVMPYFKQETLEAAQSKGSLEENDYVQAVAKYEEARKYYNKFFEENKLDSLCGPANGFPGCIDLLNGDTFAGYGMYGPAAVCGYPSITIPLGNVGDLPVGLSFLGPAFSEPKLISIGYAYEQVSRNRIQPKFKKTFA